MNVESLTNRLEAYFKEYEKLKEEQARRIGFRDNMIYINLGAVGAVSAWALADPDHYNALLIIPWVCAVLGWTYLVNDHMVSRIGRYIRKVVEPRIRAIVGSDPVMTDEGPLEEVFGWEPFHRTDARREARKIMQLVVDQITFIFAGLGAIGVFLLITPSMRREALGLAVVEIVVLGHLCYLFCRYADLQRGR